MNIILQHIFVRHPPKKNRKHGFVSLKPPVFAVLHGPKLCQAFAAKDVFMHRAWQWRKPFFVGGNVHSWNVVTKCSVLGCPRNLGKG